MSLRRALQHLFEPKDTTNLRERVDALEIAMRRLEEDWTEVYGKFRTMQLRIAKQVQRLEEDSPQGEPQGAEGEATPPERFGSLTPRAQKIQNEILARRGQKNGGG
jgi:hypothetical protein